MNESERLLLVEIQQLEKKLARQQRSDLKEFTKAALQGLCGNSSPVILDLSRDEVASLAVRLAEAALAELERRPDPLVKCAANRDGDCSHPTRPQIRDNESHATGRHCPIDTWEDPE